MTASWGIVALSVVLLARSAAAQQDRDDVASFTERFSSRRADERTRAVEELVRAPERALPVLRALLERGDLAWECEGALWDGLRRLGPAAADLAPDVERRMAKMPGERAQMHERVLVALGPKGLEVVARRHPFSGAEPTGPWPTLRNHVGSSPDAMAFVLRGLVHESAQVRELTGHVALSLRTYPPKHARSVWARLAGDAAPAVRAECLSALASLVPLDADCAAALARAVESMPEAERLDAYRLLARAGEPGVAELRRLAQGEDAARRADATVALIEAGSEPQEALWRALAAEDAGIRTAAVAALAALETAAVAGCKERLARGEHVEPVLQVVARLGTAARPLVPELERLASGPDPRIARLAARLAAKLGEPR